MAVITLDLIDQHNNIMRLPLAKVKSVVKPKPKPPKEEPKPPEEEKPIEEPEPKPPKPKPEPPTEEPKEEPLHPSCANMPWFNLPELIYNRDYMSKDVAMLDNGIEFFSSFNVASQMANAEFKYNHETYGFDITPKVKIASFAGISRDRLIAEAQGDKYDYSTGLNTEINGRPVRIVFNPMRELDFERGGYSVVGYVDELFYHFTSNLVLPRFTPHQVKIPYSIQVGECVKNSEIIHNYNYNKHIEITGGIFTKSTPWGREKEELGTFTSFSSIFHESIAKLRALSKLDEEHDEEANVLFKVPKEFFPNLVPQRTIYHKTSDKYLGGRYNFEQIDIVDNIDNFMQEKITKIPATPTDFIDIEYIVYRYSENKEYIGSSRYEGYIHIKVLTADTLENN